MIKERYLTIAFFFTTLLALALCWTVTQQAQFFCENYCEAQGGYLYSYSPGTSCKCGGIHKIIIDETYPWP
jgi:hypothetical protein